MIVPLKFIAEFSFYTLSFCRQLLYRLIDEALLVKTTWSSPYLTHYIFKNAFIAVKWHSVKTLVVFTYVFGATYEFS